VNKEAALYRYMLKGHWISHWAAIKKWRNLDFRKSITRMRRRFAKEGREVQSRWRYRAEGRRIIRYKEHCVAVSTHSNRR